MTIEEKPNGVQFDSLLNLLIFGKNMQVTFDDQCTMEALEKYWESTRNFK